PWSAASGSRSCAPRSWAPRISRTSSSRFPARWPSSGVWLTGSIRPQPHRITRTWWFSTRPRCRPGLRCTWRSRCAISAPDGAIPRQSVSAGLLVSVGQRLRMGSVRRLAPERLVDLLLEAAAVRRPREPLEIVHVMSGDIRDRPARVAAEIEDRARIARGLAGGPAIGIPAIESVAETALAVVLGPRGRIGQDRPRAVDA